MGKPSIHQAIAEIIEPVVQEENIELVDVEYKKVGKTWTLRVYLECWQDIDLYWIGRGQTSVSQLHLFFYAYAE